MPLKNKKWLSVTLHICVWSLLFSTPFIFKPEQPQELKHVEIFHDLRGFQLYFLIVNLLLASLFYFNSFFLFPKFIKNKKYGWLAVIQLLICATIIIICKQLISDAPPFPLFFYILLTAVAFCYALIKENQLNDELKKSSENERLKSELQFLRWQISPHFLFNVLNTSVSFARTQSEKLEPMLINLSQLLRYMLYESDGGKVPITKEVEYLNNYIFIQKVRFGNEVKVNFHVDIDENSIIEIEPMLLIPFIENAFKHGVGLVPEPEIDIYLTANNTQIIFSVKNKFIPHENKDKVSGIGLLNVQRRLSLLYTNKFSLNISSEDNWFYALLTIKLT